MSDRIKWIEYRGKKILYNDYTGLRGDEFTRIIKQSEAEVLGSGMKTVYVINNVTDSFMNKESTAAAKQWVKNCEQKGVDMIIALVGVGGLRRIIAQAIKRDMYFAKSDEDAKEWLVRQ
jgi:hypothetical protein